MICEYFQDSAFANKADQQKTIFVWGPAHSVCVDAWSGLEMFGMGRFMLLLEKMFRFGDGVGLILKMLRDLFRKGVLVRCVEDMTDEGCFGVTSGGLRQIKTRGCSIGCLKNAKMTLVNRIRRKNKFESCLKAQRQNKKSADCRSLSRFLYTATSRIALG